MGFSRKDTDNNEDPVFGYDPDPHYGPPRWVKVLAVIGLVVLAALVVMLVSGHHGPGRHL